MHCGNCTNALTHFLARMPGSRIAISVAHYASGGVIDGIERQFGRHLVQRKNIDNSDKFNISLLEAVDYSPLQ